MDTSQKSWAAIGVPIVFLWPFYFLGKHQSILNVHQDLKIVASEWAVTLAVGFIALGLQQKQLSWLGIRWFGWGDLLAMVGAIVGAVVLVSIAGRFVHSTAITPQEARQLPNLPPAVRISLVVTAGICEEFLYRGFAIEETALLIGNRWAAGLISLVFFTLAHTGRYGFSSALLIPGLIGLMLTLLYLWRSNLPVCMLMHAIVDGFALLVVPLLLRLPH